MRRRIRLQPGDRDLDAGYRFLGVPIDTRAHAGQERCPHQCHLRMLHYLDRAPRHVRFDLQPEVVPLAAAQHPQPLAAHRGVRGQG